MSNRNSTYESVLTNCCFTKFNESFLLFKITRVKKISGYLDVIEI